MNWCLAAATAFICIIFFTISLQIVKEKDRFRKAPPNYAMKKTQLLKDKVKSRKDLKKKKHREDLR